MNQVLGVVVTFGWANEGLPYCALALASIKVGCYFLLSDVYSFNSPSCIVGLHLFHCGCFPVYLVLCLTCVYSNPILCHSFWLLFVLAQSFLQHSSSFSNVHAFTFSTGHLLHNSSFLLRWLWLLCLYQDFAECSSRLHITSTMDLVHSANFFKLHAVCAFLHHTASNIV